MISPTICLEIYSFGIFIPHRFGTIENIYKLYINKCIIDLVNSSINIFLVEVGNIMIIIKKNLVITFDFLVDFIIQIIVNLQHVLLVLLRSYIYIICIFRYIAKMEQSTHYFSSTEGAFWICSYKICKNFF